MEMELSFSLTNNHFKLLGVKVSLLLKKKFDIILKIWVYTHFLLYRNLLYILLNINNFI